jgi:[ribosomal protein S5]-alanine N-acetyltransferase
MDTSFELFPNLISERLSLSSLKDTDYDEIFLLRSNIEVNRFIKRDPSHKNTLDFMKRVKEANSSGKSFYWVIRFQEQESILGTICLWNFSDDRLYAEVGYELLPLYHGRGIMSEALQVVLSFGFKKISLNYIEAYTNFKNERSIHLLNKNGFTLNPTKKDADFPDNLVFEISQ